MAIDIESYLLGKKKGGGGGGNIEPSKSATYTSNGEYTVAPTTGYDGIGEVNVEVSVQPNLESKSYAVTTNGTKIISPSTGYDGMSDVVLDVQVPQQGDTLDLSSGIKFGNSNFQTVPNIIANANWSSVIDATNMFATCYYMTDFPQVDTSNIELLGSMFSNCGSLTNFPVLDLSGAVGIDGMVNWCSNLSNQSLNNIMASLATCTDAHLAYNNTPKILSWIGLSETQIDTCVTLSNWSTLVAKGWKTGKEQDLNGDIDAIIACIPTGDMYEFPQRNILNGYIGVNLTRTLHVHDINSARVMDFTAEPNSDTFASDDGTLAFTVFTSWDEQGTMYFAGNVTQYEIDVYTYNKNYDSSTNKTEFYYDLSNYNQFPIYVSEVEFGNGSVLVNETIDGTNSPISGQYFIEGDYSNTDIPYTVIH